MENLRNQHTEDIADLYFDFDRRNAFCCIAYFTNRLTASVWVNYKDTPDQALEAGARYFKDSFKLLDGQFCYGSGQFCYGSGQFVLYELIK